MQITQETFKIIELAETNQILEKNLAHEEMILLYTIIGLFACNQKVNEQERVQLIGMIFERKLT